MRSRTRAAEKQNVAVSVFQFKSTQAIPGIFEWLEKLNIDHNAVRFIASINAGFDETSFIIKAKFPRSDLKVFDFYNAKQHTEAAIKRARKVSLVYPDTQQIASDSIPIKNNEADIIFCYLLYMRSDQTKRKFNF